MRETHEVNQNVARNGPSFLCFRLAPPLLLPGSGACPQVCRGHRRHSVMGRSSQQEVNGQKQEQYPRL